MTTRYKTRAFVFKKNDRNESDRLFSVFSNEFGKLDIFAKAIRKSNSKLRSGFDLFNLSEIEFVQGKNKKTLTEAIILEKFKNIDQDLERFKVANQIGDILDNFIRGEEKDTALFNLINEVFLNLNDQNLNIKKCTLLYYYFLWNALSLLGYHSEVQKCVICNDKLIPYNIYFSSEEGGVICKKCLLQKKQSFSHIIRINSDIIKVLRIILLRDWLTLSRLKIELSSQKLLEQISENAINSFHR